jgi:hypothetical protein
VSVYNFTYLKKEHQMQKEQIRVELSINGLQVTAGYEFLERITCDIPDIKENKKVFEALAKSDDFEVRRSISYKDNLNKNTIDMLIQDADSDVVGNISNNSNIAKYITQEQVENILKQDNTYLLEILGKNVDDFQSCNVCKIIDKLIKHPNARVRGSVLRYRNNLSLVQLEILSNDSDTAISSEARKQLKDRKS